MIPIKHRLILFSFQVAGYIISLCAGLTLYFDYHKVGKPPPLLPPPTPNECQLVVDAPCLCNSTNQYYFDLLKNLDELKVPFRIEASKNCNCPKEESNFILPSSSTTKANQILTFDTDAEQPKLVSQEEYLNGNKKTEMIWVGGKEHSKNLQQEYLEKDKKNQLIWLYWADGKRHVVDLLADDYKIAHDFEKPINNVNLTSENSTIESQSKELKFLSTAPCTEDNIGDVKYFSKDSYYLCNGLYWQYRISYEGEDNEYLVLP